MLFVIISMIASSVDKKIAAFEKRKMPVLDPMEKSWLSPCQIVVNLK